MIKNRLNVALTIFMITAFTCFAGEKPKPERELLNNLLTSCEKNDLEGFVKDGMVEFKDAMKPDVLNGLHKQLGEHLKNGYHLTYFGKLKKDNYDVHIWKLEYVDGMDDALLRLVLENGKVAGFFIQ